MKLERIQNYKTNWYLIPNIRFKLLCSFWCCESELLTVFLSLENSPHLTMTSWSGAWVLMLSLQGFKYVGTSNKVIMKSSKGKDDQLGTHSIFASLIVPNIIQFPLITSYIIGGVALFMWWLCLCPTMQLCLDNDIMQERQGRIVRN